MHTSKFSIGLRAVLTTLKPIVLSTILAIPYSTSLAQNYDSVYQKMNDAQWQILFYDDGRTHCPDDSHELWSLDGANARVEREEQGLTLYAGNTGDDDADNTVLWTKKSFKGDIKIEYDYTRIDTTDANTVNIIYIQATGSGKGDYAKDIMEWSALRSVSAMRLYFNNMHSYHISYATSGAPGSGESMHYVRGRRYNATTLRGTELKPEYLNVDLFEVGVTHHISIIKRGDRLVMRVTAQGGKQRVFYFDGSAFAPITEGYVGLRQMNERISRYTDITIYGLD